LRIHPSILAADFSRLADEIRRVPSADAIHVDVMDNHFVPNLTFGHQMVQRLGEVSSTPIDVHLMIENVDYEAPRFAEFGVSSITFHIEASEDPGKTIAAIRSHGVRAAVAIRPSSDFELIKPLLSEADMILIMTVEPGFGGQKLIPEMVERVRMVRSITKTDFPGLWIQVDGGVDASNIAELSEAGANVFVAGSSVFRHPEPNQAVLELKKLSERLA
jgi:ribulose-phosphate 3-epimerase